MKATWTIVRRSLISLLRRRAARRRWREIREEKEVLRRWPAARLVASFLARRTTRLDLRQEVLGTLLRLATKGGPRAEVAATILLLAGALAASGRRRGGAPPPLVLIIDVPGRPPAVVRPLFPISGGRAVNR